MKHSLRSLLWITLSYALIAKLTHTLLLTIVTSFVLMTGKSGSELPNTVNEIASQFIFFGFACGAILFSLSYWLGQKALYRKSEFWNQGDKKFWQLSYGIKSDLRRGAGSGLILAILIVALFSYGGQVSYLGLFITSTVGTSVFPLFLLNFVSLMAVVICEEFIFRYRILGSLHSECDPLLAVLLSSVSYIFVKAIQFDLAWLDVLNLLLLNLTLGFFFLRNLRAHRGIAFTGVFFLVIHAVAGLPLWGQSGPSFFLFKHNAQNTNDLLSGATGGPLAGLGVTSVLVFLLFGAYWAWREKHE